MDIKKFIDYVSNYFIDIQRDKLIAICLSLLSCKRTEKEALILLKDTYIVSDILNEIYMKNLIKLNNILDNKLKTLAIYETSFFGGQLKYLTKKISNDTRYNCISLIVDEFFQKNNTIDKISEFIKSPFIFIPNEKLLSKYEFLDAVVMNEGYKYKTSLPKNTIRIIQPHGLDVPSETTITKYGGANIGNYILAPMQEELKSESSYKNYFSKKMIEHSSNYTCVIPCGYPKLDEFIKKCDSYKSQRSKIILHFSHTSFQSKEACEDIGITLELLLNEFPSHDIVFRPYPTEINEPLVVKAWEKVKDNPRAYLSTNSSYIDDYAGADFLVSHRIETAQTFAYATGNPIIYFSIEENSQTSQEHSRGYLVYTHEQLISTAKNILSDKNRARERILNYRNQLLCNPGNSVDYLLDNLDYILEDKKHPNWQYFKLYDKNVEVDDEKEFENSLERAIKEKRAFENIARSAIFYYPNNDKFKYYLILALFKTPASAKDHYYFKWYEGMKISVELYTNTENNNIKNMISELYINSLFSKLYQLKDYVLRNEKPFNILMAEMMSKEMFNEYIKNYRLIIENNIKYMHSVLDNPTTFQKKFYNFLKKNQNQKIVIWGAGESIDCLIPMISNNIFIVDKKLFNQIKVLKDEKIVIKKPQDIEVIKPNIIIIASQVFYKEIYKEIRDNYSKTIDILSIDEFR